MKVALGVTGSIAAYRSPDFVKELLDLGHEVRVILTRSAAELVSARVLETVSGKPVISSDPFAADHAGTDHIEAARWADAFVIYAATADFLSRYAQGQAGESLTLQLIATRAPVLIAPAMNPAMWEHPATQANVRLLQSRGVHFAGPVAGKVACGETGVGHIAEHSSILAALAGMGLTAPGAETSAVSGTAGLSGLSGKRLLISAGPMRTSIDPVRYVQNRSSGKMGLEVARAALASGAHVSVLLGPVDASIAAEYAGFEVTRYQGPDDYTTALDELFPLCDAFLSLAAVLDFELSASDSKIEREALSRQTELRAPLSSVPDLVARMASRKRADQRVFAFAAESGTDAQIVERATSKMKKKGVDALAANPVRPGLGPEADSNEFWVLKPGSKPLHLGPARKSELARPLLQALFA
jgi:phosphopantothenoylcysteine decarboxylase/phosphopantothenate--cysteine ligase